MIDIRKLKELVRLMVENDLSELDLKDKEETVTVKRGTPGGAVINHQPVIYNGTGAGPMPTAPVAVTARAAPIAEEAAPGDTPAEVDTTGLIVVKSPMVGTFYASANPDAPPFVTSGTPVSPDTVVCLIEAMKVFNEIKAETSGTIERVLVQSGTAVEFGQKLFLVKPS